MKITAFLLTGLFCLQLGGCSASSFGTQSLRLPSAQFKSPALFKFNAAEPRPDLYAPVQGKSGMELLTGLKSLVGRHKDLGYDMARDAMFGTVDDPDNDDIVEDVYLGKKLDRIHDRRSAYRGGQGFNAEHVWPQSKGAEGVAKSDLHHLMSSDINANGKRSSFPFGEVVQVVWADGDSALGHDAQNRMVFEPRDSRKGNIARSIFYFYTVYGLNGHLDLSNFKIEEEVLKRWNQQDPVDQEERLRNQAVFQFQGNRNPYIDHPEFIPGVQQFLPQ